jgi:hypothetical protein
MKNRNFYISLILVMNGDLTLRFFKIDKEDKIHLLSPQIMEVKGKVEQYPDFDDE